MKEIHVYDGIQRESTNPANYDHFLLLVSHWSLSGQPQWSARRSARFNAFIKIKLVWLFAALAVKTKTKHAILSSEETKTTIALRARKRRNTTKFTSVTYVWLWLRELKELQISYSQTSAKDLR